MRTIAIALILLLPFTLQAGEPPLDPHAGHNHADDSMAMTADSASHADLGDDPTLPGKLQPAGDRYVCPMHPQIVRDEPGSCPICGMTLQLVKAAVAGGALAVSPEIRQSLGLTTTKAEPRTLWRYIETLGEISWDERRLVHIHSRASGWLERLVARNTGDFVKQGELLYEIYAPDLVAAQNDFLNALTVIKRDTNSRSLYQRARLRLELLGLTHAQIDQVEKSGEAFYRVPVYAPNDGYITELAVRQGMYVEPQMTLMQLADRSSLYLIAQVFGDQIPWLKVGMPVELDLAEAGIHKREATIDLLYPELDPVTRAQKVRIRLDNSDGQLRPGMLAQVRLYGGARQVAVAVPRQALLSSGSDNRLVIEQEDGQFRVVKVTVGMISRDYVEISSGLNAGEKVVTSGQFLLDAEAQLQAAAGRMDGEATTANHHH